VQTKREHYPTAHRDGFNKWQVTSPSNASSCFVSFHFNW